MKTQTHTQGIHHITAVASSAPENLVFYREVMGLRLIKKTVNFDDPYTYHFYYGDAAGSPGTILTFFPWENIPKGRAGAGMVSAVAFSIPAGAMEYWYQRLAAEGIEVDRQVRFDDPVLRFNDPHGLPLELIGLPNAPPPAELPDGPVPGRHAIVGFHSATAILNSTDRIHELLTTAMGMTLAGQEKNRRRYRMQGDDHYGNFYDVVEDGDARNGKPGGGTVHHIAFRARDDEQQLAWQKSLTDMGYAVTPVRDRNYFRSIYFSSPGGVLFEIATDPPGFTVDEDISELGRSLKLPVQYEPRRSDIEARLPPLTTATFRHLFVEARYGEDDGNTLVTLHGTGGSERDLVGVAADVAPCAAVLSPRGKVLENGMPRYFRRLADGIFDEDDVMLRARELAEFLEAAAPQYGRSPEKLVALGYSNGANIAAAILMLRPEVFSRAVLLRPMLPLQHVPIPDLEGKEILILNGRRDRVIPADGTRGLIRFLEAANAKLTNIEMDAGHELTGADIEAVSAWLEKTRPFQPQAVSNQKAEPVR